MSINYYPTNYIKQDDESEYDTASVSKVSIKDLPNGGNGTINTPIPVSTTVVANTVANSNNGVGVGSVNTHGHVLPALPSPYTVPDINRKTTIGVIYYFIIYMLIIK